MLSRDTAVVVDPRWQKTRRNRSTMTKLSCWSLWDFNVIWNRLFPTQSMLSKEKKKIHEQREHQISSKATCIRHFRVSQLTSDISFASAYLGRVTHICFRKAGLLSKPLLICCELSTWEHISVIFDRNSKFFIPQNAPEMASAKLRIFWS